MSPEQLPTWASVLNLVFTAFPPASGWSLGAMRRNDRDHTPSTPRSTPSRRFSPFAPLSYALALSTRWPKRLPEQGLYPGVPHPRPAVCKEPVIRRATASFWVRARTRALVTATSGTPGWTKDATEHVQRKGILLGMPPAWPCRRFVQGLLASLMPTVYIKYAGWHCETTL